MRIAKQLARVNRGRALGLCGSGMGYGVLTQVQKHAYT
jgi:hypothetical protein